MLSEDGLASTLDDAYRLLQLDSGSRDFINTFYIPRRRSLGTFLLFEIKNRDSPAKFLYSGHRGSGKTTELRHLSELLKKEQFTVVFISATKDAPLSDLYYTDILLLLIRKTLDLLSDKKTIKKMKEMNLDSDVLGKLEKLREQLGGENQNVGTRTQTSAYNLGAISKSFVEIVTRHQDETSVREVIRDRAEKKTDSIIDTFNQIVNSFQESTGKKIVVIIDDLEKVTELQRISDLLLGHYNHIDALKCHIVFTIPPSLANSTDFTDLWTTFGKIYFMPPFNIRNKDQSINNVEIQQMESIVRKRVSNTVISSEISQRAALFSGGLINDFLKLLIYSCPKAAMIENNSKIDNESLNESFRDLIKDYRLSLETEYYPKLVQVHKDKDILIDEDHKKMLYRSAILEYENPPGNTWYDIHPVFEQILKDNGII